MCWAIKRNPLYNYWNSFMNQSILDEFQRQHAVSKESSVLRFYQHQRKEGTMSKAVCKAHSSPFISVWSCLFTQFFLVISLIFHKCFHFSLAHVMAYIHFFLCLYFCFRFSWTFPSCFPALSFSVSSLLFFFLLTFPVRSILAQSQSVTATWPQLSIFRLEYLTHQFCSHSLTQI